MVRKHLPLGYVPGPQLSPNNKKLVDQTGHSHSVSKNIVKTNSKTKLKNSLWITILPKVFNDMYIIEI